MKKIKLGDYIDILTDYHSGGSYKILKANTKILHKPDYAVYIRTLNFERDDFKKDLIYCDKKSYDFLAYSHIQENDILMNKIANPGSVYIMPKVDYLATCGMNLFLIRCKNINQRYMYYVMKNNEDYIKNQTHGTTTKTITKEEVRELEFNIHEDKIERDKIESLLTNIDSKIEVNKLLIDIYENLAKTIFNHWFLEFDYPNEKGLPYKTSGGSMKYNEILKMEIPAELKLMNLSDFLNENKKSTIQVKNVETAISNIPFFTSGEDIKLVNESLIDGLNLYLSTGGNANISIFNGPASYSTDTWCVNYGKYTYYNYLFMNSIKDYINDYLFCGSALKHLQKEQLKQISLVKPNDYLIDKFNNFVEPIFSNISNIFIDNLYLKQLKNFLLPLLMNGQARFENE